MTKATEYSTPDGAAPPTFGLSRRKALFATALSALGIGAATAAAGATIPLATSSSDAELLVLCAQFQNHQADLEAWNDDELEAEEGEAANEQWWIALRQIVATPALTMEGIKAKARVLYHTVPMLTDAPEIDGDLGVSLAEDIMNMGAVA